MTAAAPGGLGAGDVSGTASGASNLFGSGGGGSSVFDTGTSGIPFLGDTSGSTGGMFSGFDPTGGFGGIGSFFGNPMAMSMAGFGNQTFDPTTGEMTNAALNPGGQLTSDTSGGGPGGGGPQGLFDQATPQQMAQANAPTPSGAPAAGPVAFGGPTADPAGTLTPDMRNIDPMTQQNVLTGGAPAGANPVQTQSINPSDPAGVDNPDSAYNQSVLQQARAGGFQNVIGNAPNLLNPGSIGAPNTFTTPEGANTTTIPETMPAPPQSEPSVPQMQGGDATPFTDQTGLQTPGNVPAVASAAGLGPRVTAGPMPGVANVNEDTGAAGGAGAGAAPNQYGLQPGHSYQRQDGSWVTYNGGDPSSPGSFTQGRNGPAGAGQGAGRGGMGGLGVIGSLIGGLMRMMPPQVAQAFQQFMQMPGVQQFLSSLAGGQMPGMMAPSNPNFGAQSASGTPLPGIFGQQGVRQVGTNPDGTPQLVDRNGNRIEPRIAPGDVATATLPGVGGPLSQSPISAPPGTLGPDQLGAADIQPGIGQTPQWSAADNFADMQRANNIAGHINSLQAGGGNVVPHPTMVAQSVANALQQSGASSNAIRGIMMNIRDESGFRPTVPGDHGASFGLFQMQGATRRALMSWSRSQGRDPRDPATQAQFVAHYLQAVQPRTWQRMNAATSPGRAATIFLREFERPAARYADARAARYLAGG